MADFARMMTGLEAETTYTKTIVVHAIHLKAHRTEYGEKVCQLAGNLAPHRHLKMTPSERSGSCPRRV